MPSYTITEPHPTVPQNSYTHAGRGGAGNIFRAPATTPASGVPTSTSVTATTTGSSSSSGSRFYSGRGGAGNARPAAARPVISFDEEYRERTVTTSSAGYVGRGGAGNAVASRAGGRKDSDASSGSDSSSVRSGFWARLKGEHH